MEEVTITKAAQVIMDRLKAIQGGEECQIADAHAFNLMGENFNALNEQRDRFVGVQMERGVSTNDAAAALEVSPGRMSALRNKMKRQGYAAGPARRDGSGSGPPNSVWNL